MVLLVCHIISRDHAFEGLRDLMGELLSRKVIPFLS